MLNVPRFPVRELNLSHFRAYARILTALLTGFRLTDTRGLSAHLTLSWRQPLADAGANAASWTRLRLLRLAVPLGVVKVVVRFDEVVNREIVFAIVEAGPAPDGLLEFNHRVDRAHKDDVADVPRIDAR